MHFRLSAFTVAAISLIHTSYIFAGPFAATKLADAPYNPQAAFGSIKPEECSQYPPQQRQLAQELFTAAELTTADPIPSTFPSAGVWQDAKPLLLQVVVNDLEIREPGLFVLRRCGTLLVRVEDLNNWRIITDREPKITLNGIPFVNIARFPGLRYGFDEKNESLVIEGEPFIFTPLRADFDRTSFPTPDKVLPGAFFNYGIINAGDVTRFNPNLGGYASLGLFSEYGSLNSSWGLGYNIDNGNFSYGRAFTTYNYDFNKTAQTLQIGDVNTSGSTVGGGLSLGGISFGTNYGLQPGRITTPVQDFDFALRRISHANLVNASLFPNTNETGSSIYNTYGSGVAYGPIEYRNVPVSGNLRYQWQFKDRRGLDSALFDSVVFNNSGLSRKGLYDYQYAVGLLRGGENGELSSDTYNKLAFSTAQRYGFSNYFTAGLNFDTTTERNFAGLTTLTSVPYFGVVSLSAGQAWESGDSFSGDKRIYSYGLSNTWNSFGYSFSVIRTGSTFGTLQQFDPVNTLSRAMQATLFFSLPWGDGINTRYNDIRLRPGVDPARLNLDDSRRSIDIEYLFSRIRNVQIRLFANRQFGNGSDTTFGLSLSSSFKVRTVLDFLGFGQSDKANNAADGDSLFDPDNTYIGYGISTDIDKRVGGGVSFSTGDSIGRHSFGINANQTGNYQGRYIKQPYTAAAYYSYRSPYFTDNATISYSDRRANYNLSLQGGILFVDNKIRFSQPIYGSLAVVRLGKDLAGVKVNGYESDRNGDAIVSGLSGYDFNRIFIGLEDIPLNISANDLTAQVVPRNQSVVEVNFKLPLVIDAVMNVIIKTKDNQIRTMPLGAYAIVTKVVGGREQPPEDRFPFGEDGYLYLSGLGEHNDIKVFFSGRSCVFTISVPKNIERDSFPELGEQVCKE